MRYELTNQQIESYERDGFVVIVTLEHTSAIARHLEQPPAPR